MPAASCATSTSSSRPTIASTRNCGRTLFRHDGRWRMWKDSDPRDVDGRDEALWDTRERIDDPRGRDSLDPRDVFREGLDLPRGRERERVFLDGDTFELRGSEVRTLSTIGAFRVVAVDERLEDRKRAGDLWHGEIERLQTAALIRAIGHFD